MILKATFEVKSKVTLRQLDVIPATFISSSFSPRMHSEMRVWYILMTLYNYAMDVMLNNDV